MAFLLLIFFLVTTTMNVDSGIQRKLPPAIAEDAEVDVNRRNMMTVNVSQFNEVQVNRELVDLSQITELVKKHLANPTDDPNMSAKEEKTIPLIGTYMVSQGVVSLINHRSTSYDMYIKVQNELVRAFNEMRDEAARAKFGSDFMQLKTEERDVIAKAVPQAISEAEPHNVGGN